MTLKLHHLRPAPGAKTAKTRVGRGEASKGKTAGRGTKGSKARYQVPAAFEGGQMPLYMRLPKRGFNKPNRKEYEVVNLGLIQKFIDMGRIDVAQPITEDILVQSGVLRRSRDGIRVLAKGEITSAVNLQVTGASAGAIAAVEAAGGTLKVSQAAAPADTAA